MYSITRDGLQVNIWNKIKELLPAEKPKTGRPNKDHFIIVEGILWVLLEYVSKEDAKKPKYKRNYYEAFEIPKKITVKHPDGRDRKYKYRFIFVCSSIKAKAEKTSREKGIRKVEQELKYLASRLNSRNSKTRKEIEKFCSFLNSLFNGYKILKIFICNIL
ncbi:MAG: transposase [Candidatus Brocadiae bacterium]|nr:transposase [Candidatus Brocadiia bacterium]